MTKDDYRFVTGYWEDSDVSLSEISDNIEHPVGHTVISGKNYRIDAQAAARFTAYKNSPQMAAVRLSSVTGIPYPLFYPGENGRLLQETFYRSLFDPVVHQTVREIRDFCPDFFNAVTPLLIYPGTKVLKPGDFVPVTGKLVNVASFHNVFYRITLNDRRYTTRTYQIDETENRLTDGPSFFNQSKETAYEAIACNITSTLREGISGGRGDITASDCARTYRYLAFPGYADEESMRKLLKDYQNLPYKTGMQRKNAAREAEHAENKRR